MAKTVLCTGLAALVLAYPGSTGSAQTPAQDDTIVVSIPQKVLIDRHDSTNAPIYLWSVSVNVKVADLDLRNQMDWQTLESRLRAGSGEACGTIERMNPVAFEPGDATCRKNAYRGGLAQARSVRASGVKVAVLKMTLKGS